MLQKIVKYGNSRAVVLPKEIVDQLRVKEGDWVDVELRNGGVVIQAVDIIPRISEEDRKFVEEFYKKNEAVFKALAE